MKASQQPILLAILAWSLAALSGFPSGFPCLAQSEDENHPTDLRFQLGARSTGVGFGNYTTYSGARFNLSDRNVQEINGLNFTLGVPREFANSRMNGVSVGLLSPGFGTLRGVAIGTTALQAQRSATGVVLTPGWLAADEAHVRGIGVAGVVMSARKLEGIAFSGGALLSGESLTGISFAGLGNLGKGSHTGLHAGGLALYDSLGITGVGVAGLGVVTGGDLIGIHAGGLAVYAGGDTVGIQTSLGMVGTRGSSTGIGLAGIASFSTDDQLGVRISGIATAGLGSLQGISAAALMVASRDQDLIGVNVSGLSTSAGRDIAGLAIGGLGVSAERHLTGLAASLGWVSVAARTTSAEYDPSAGVAAAPAVTPSSLTGLALAGVRLRADEITGLTATLGYQSAVKHTGLAVAAYNRFGSQRGLSVGILNRADHLTGVQVGFLNYCGENPRWLRWLPGLNLNMN